MMGFGQWDWKREYLHAVSSDQWILQNETACRAAAAVDKVVEVTGSSYAVIRPEKTLKLEISCQSFFKTKVVSDENMGVASGSNRKL